MRRLMKPCITTWPAYVPTLELDRPEASSATANASAAPPPSSVLEAGVRALDRVDVGAAAVVEQLRRDDEHRQVDDPGEAHREHDVEALEAQQLALLAPCLRRDPVRGQRRVQVDDVRHHGRAEDADGEQHAVGAVEAAGSARRRTRPGRRRPAAGRT